MPKPIQVLTPEEFDSALESWVPARKITQVHVHCTDHPNHAEFRGLASIEAMRRFHQSHGMNDIAQHLTVDPSGLLWTGRPFDAMPASVRRHNGTTAAGPFMIEMVGLFDQNKDTFDGRQKEAAQGVVCSVLRKFGLKEDAVRFHREFPNTGKTCPGNALDPKVFRKEIAKRLADEPRAAEITVPRGIERTAIDRDAMFDKDLEENTLFSEVPEDAASVEEQVLLARWIDRDLLGPTADGVREVADKYRDLIPYVVNTSQGFLSVKGDFTNKPEDLARLVDVHLKNAFDSGECKHLLLYAHGGLVTEKGALDYARTIAPWWRANGVYPIFFVWESSLLQAIFEGRREIGRGTAARGELSDKILEGLTQVVARKVWRRMKANARRCSAKDAGEGEAGGLYQFWQKLKVWLAAHPGQAKLHAIGHSTGPILLAPFMKLALQGGVEFSTLSYFAPAIRIDDFVDEVLPNVHRTAMAGIRRLRQFTMNDAAEREDDVATIYTKSLLYYVRQACEDDTDGRILGLERDLYGDPKTRALFGLPGAPGVLSASSKEADPLAQIDFAVPADDFPQNPRTKATRHGCFDNEEATVTSALREILGDPKAVPSPLVKFPWPGTSGCKSSRDVFRDLDEDFAAAASEAPCCCCRKTAAVEDELDGSDLPASEDPKPAAGPSGVGRRIALCVGIDRYPRQPLTGCVRDSRNWAAALRKLGFEVRELHDGEATRANLVRGLRDLLRDGRAGDQLVFQYSGHGAQVKDVSGDERDRFDEVLVPVDFDQGALLIDDDLYELCQGLRRGTTLTLLMDCCHSGTNSRFAPPVSRSTQGAVPRFLRLNASEIAAHERVRRGTRSAPPVGERNPLPGVVSIAACRDNEVAFEEDGQGNFSRHALVVIGKVLAGRGTNQDFLEAVRSDFGEDLRQHPLMPKPAGGLESVPFLGGR
ncbi:MAG: caspase family protein [Acidobacteriota bacterium]